MKHAFGPYRYPVEEGESSFSVFHYCGLSMEQPQANLMYIALLLLFFTFSLYYYYYSILTSRRIWLGGQYRKLPPGPPSWPLLGHLHLLQGPALPHVVLKTLASTYGPLFSLRLGTVPIVVVSSPAMASCFMADHDLAFVNRPVMSAGQIIHYNCRNLGWMPYGKYWRFLRRICQTHLFSPAKVLSTAHIRSEEVAAAIRHITAQQLVQPRQTATDVRRRLYIILTNFIARLVFNQPCSSDNNPVLHPDFDKMIQEMFVLNGVFNLGDFIPSIKWMDLQGYQRRMKRVAKQFDELLQNIINERRHQCQNQSEKTKLQNEDFMDILLGLAEEHREEFNLTDDHVKAFVMEMFGAGTETSSTTVEWALSEILLQPRVLERLHEELDNLIGKNRVVEESDIPHLPYLNAVVKETLRLHPPAPFLIPRESTQACEVMGGYGIPSGTRLFINVYAIGRDEVVWEDATSFKPERFLTNTTPGHHGNITNEPSIWVNPMIQHGYKLMPFGAGRRVCPAMSMGMCLIHFVLARLLHSFDWSPSPSQPIDMDEMFGLTLTRAQPLFAIATPRLSSSTY